MVNSSGNFKTVPKFFGNPLINRLYRDKAKDHCYYFHLYTSSAVTTTICFIYLQNLFLICANLTKYQGKQRPIKHLYFISISLPPLPSR